MVLEPKSGLTAKAAVAPHIVSWFAHLGCVAAILGGSRALKAAVPGASAAPDVANALADADACILRNDWPQWQTLRAADSPGCAEKLWSMGGGPCAVRP